MPVHDWTRVDAGIFHAFHHDWVTEISRALNRGLLPRSYYALPEQIAGGLGPDVLGLRLTDPDGGGVVPRRSGRRGGVGSGPAQDPVPYPFRGESVRRQGESGGDPPREPASGRGNG